VRRADVQAVVCRVPATVAPVTPVVRRRRDRRLPVADGIKVLFLDAAVA
jgi:hypothetical protein